MYSPAVAVTENSIGPVGGVQIAERDVAIESRLDRSVYLIDIG